jgi:hypothetical protein
MLSATHARAMSRFAAVLVAFAMTGAPRAMAAPPRRAERQCSCPAHALHRACPCGQCHAPSAARAAAGHGRDQGHGREDAPPAPARVIGSCGMPEAPAASAPRAAEPFTLAAAVVVPAGERSEVAPCARSAPAEASREPETPPPRARA